MRLADTARDRADMHVAEIDVPAVLAFGISAAGECRHTPIEAPLGRLGKSH
jgi:hypothetical protein